MDKKELQISDIIYQLQQINYAELLDALSPVIITYVGNRAVSKAIDIYNLRKDYKPQNIKSISLPPEVMTQTSEINNEELVRQQFGNSILNFANTVKERIPNADLTFLYNNLQSLNVACKSLKLYNFIFKKGTAGTYDVKKNEIVVREDDYLETIDHEMFHMASSVFRKSDGMRFCGFSQSRLKTLKKIGDGINEGYTQLLSERYFGDKDGVAGAYPLEVHLVEKLEQIIGKDKMEYMFFRADLNGLIQTLKQYDSEENIMKFISGVDFLHNHFSDKKLLPLENGMIQNSLTSVNQFLIKCYTEKLKTELNNGEIDSEVLKERLATYISMLGTSITNRNGKKVRKYDFLTLESIGSVINEMLGTQMNITMSDSPENESISKGK